MRIAGVFGGIIQPMNSLAELDYLNLGSAAKAQIAALVQSLLDQQEHDANQLQQSKDAEIKAKDFKIEALTHELAYYKRIRFSRQNESLAPLQRDVFEETWKADLSAIEAEVEQLKDGPPCDTVAKPKRPRAGRPPLPAHPPRIEVRHEPESCVCGKCGNPNLVKMGEDITEQLHVEPAKFSVVRHIRPQYACRPCETLMAEPIPPAVIDGGMATVALLAWVMVSKYLGHLPLCRLGQIAGREGVTLSRSTLADWVGRIGVTLQPLVDRLIWHLLQGNTLPADETPVAQLDPGNGKTRKAYLWAYRSNDLAGDRSPRIIVFDYRKGRSGEYAREFLGDWKGHLMVDDYAGYKALFINDNDGETRIGLAFPMHAENSSICISPTRALWP